MLVNCSQCKIFFNKAENQIGKSNNHFCSRSCAGKYNNKKFPKRKKEGKCFKCNTPIKSKWVYCEECRSTIDRFTPIIPFEKLTRNNSIKNRLIEERGRKCEICNLSSWMGKDINLELHHIDGNNKNNDKSNLQILCLNCHSFTDNFRNRKRR